MKSNVVDLNQVISERTELHDEITVFLRRDKIQSFKQASLFLAAALTVLAVALSVSISLQGFVANYFAG